MWVVIAGVVAAINLLMVTANTAIAASDLFGSKGDDLKQIDGRERIRVANPSHPFSFTAVNICNEDTELCVTVWGSGWFNTDRDQMTARGGIVRTVDTATLSSGFWVAIDLISGSDKDVTFRARTGSSTINIIINEGDRKNPAEACVYGVFVGISSPEDAICTEDVRANIR